MLYRLFNLILVLLSFALLAQVGYSIWHKRVVENNAEQPIALPSTHSQPMKANEGYNLLRMVNANLFGVAVKTQPIVIEAKVPQTKLSLQLHGMVGSNDENLARALISVGAALPKSFGIGEAIPNTDASIHRIDKTQVLLNRGGQIESLSLNRKVLESNSSTQ